MKGGFKNLIKYFNNPVFFFVLTYAVVFIICYIIENVEEKNKEIDRLIKSNKN